jgi:hypothetical protein
MDHVEKKTPDEVCRWARDTEFSKIIPKSPSRKILRHILRDSDKEIRVKPSTRARI